MRIKTAFEAFFAILFNQERAAAWRRLTEGAAAEGAARSETAPDVSADAVYTLTLLQRQGRLIDFLEEDIDAYDDAQVGTAVRQIHQGCRQVLEENFGVKPVRAETEGEKVDIPEGFDPARVRLTGNVSGKPPFAGTLQHCGWRITKVDFPDRHAKLDPKIICPAEVEV